MGSEMCIRDRRTRVWPIGHLTYGVTAKRRYNIGVVLSSVSCDLMLPSIFAPGTLFARIFHASPVAMTVNALPDGAYLDVNDSFVRLVGYSRAELIGRRAIDLGIITPDKRQPVVQNLINKRQLANSPQELRHRSGAVRRVIVSAQVEEYEGELFTAAIIQDLTDYHHTQDALRTSEARFRLFFESVPLGVWVFDRVAAGVGHQPAPGSAARQTSVRP